MRSLAFGPQFILSLKPNPKNPRAGREERPSRSRNLRLLFLPWKREKTWCSRKGRETLTAQGVPKSPLGMVSAPLGLHLPPPPAPTPLPRFQIRKLDVPRCGSGPRPARNRRRRSLPRITLRSPGGGWTGTRAPISPTTPHRPRGRAKGVRTGRPAPALSVATRCLRALEPASRGAVAPCAGYLPSLWSSRGGARRAPRWE